MSRALRCWCGNSDLIPFSSTYVQCLACETLVVAQMPGLEVEQVTDDAQDFYGREYWFAHQENIYGYPNIIRRSRTDLPERCLYWLRVALKYKLPPGRVLELGSAHGGFVALLHWAGFEATGLELSPWVVEFARTTFGVPMLLGPVEAQQLEPASLDMIALMDVLEHLPDPVGTMRHCLQLLKPDGILIIQTPHWVPGQTYEELAAQRGAFLEQLKEEEHLYLFSPPALREFFRRLKADCIVFEPALFDQYDMCLVVSRAPIVPRRCEEVEPALTVRPSGRVIQGFLDMDEQLRNVQRKRSQGYYGSTTLATVGSKADRVHSAIGASAVAA